MNPLNERITRIENELKAILPDSVDSEWLNAVAGQDCPEARPAWADQFLQPGRELLGRGGKRWRPLVTVLTCEALGGGHAADRLAPLTEIPHNGSLIVDDIEDASQIRRGALAVHLMFGDDLAINMGNLMYFLPSLILEDCEAAVVRDWLAVMRRLHLGQGYDILWHREPGLFPDEAAYLRMCRFKTGSLSSLAALLGARAASAHVQTGEDLIKELGNVWEDLGTGFQILDDVQNISSGIPGKDHGDDIVEGKKSLPVIIHASKHPEDTGRLTQLFREAAEHAPKGDWSAVSTAVEMLRDSGATDAARKYGQELLYNGHSRLMSLLPENESRALMLEMVDGFISKMT